MLLGLVLRAACLSLVLRDGLGVPRPGFGVAGDAEAGAEDGGDAGAGAGNAEAVAEDETEAGGAEDKAE